MPKYVLTYHGEMGPMPEEQAAIDAIMAEWGAWYGEIGDALVDGGAPFGETAAIGPDGSDMANPASITGYTIINADDITAAKTVAKGCPVLKDGHAVQVSQAIDM